MENTSDIKKKIPSSFRDPSGFLFLNNGVLYRQINFSYKKHYDYFISSGLLDLLIKKKLIIFHQEDNFEKRFSDEAYKIIQPEPVWFISYPYEWCFGQLKDSALAMLQIQRHALEHGMTLKDATAYNMQFVRGKPTLIDTTSFEIYKEGEPWIAYRQFCQHFLLPLALMSFRDARLVQLMKIYIDGMPLDLASSLLPLSGFLKNPWLYAHIRLHAKAQNHKARQAGKQFFLSKKGLFLLIDNLQSSVKSLKWNLKDTEWADYYDKTNYSENAFLSKKEIIGIFLKDVNPGQVWDIGGNTGVFSRIASKKGIKTICFDADPVAVEKNYLETRINQEENILPLQLDFINPSPAIGWANRERNSLEERGLVDMVFALALVHHLVIAFNIPFPNIAEFLSRIGKSLIVEFVPGEDSQLKRMLASSMKDFPDYNQENFENAFKQYFLVKEARQVKDSKRIIYLMKKL
ncbi:MAG: class I SAM-dependent methyltransferase [Candidatus Staskawiczbacteria bacterium]|nr:class I SAM-dependent methyltransferase [Candidatus Staskawiczbacteria bacterium]